MPRGVPLSRSLLHCRPLATVGKPAELGGYLPLAPGVSTVRYPIPERIFDYVSAVLGATAGTCQLPTWQTSANHCGRALRIGAQIKPQ